jgi:hypothetical protein
VKDLDLDDVAATSLYAIFQLKALRAELAEARRDVELAAGELVVAMPKPGTDMARVMIANAMMRRERDALRAELAEARRDAERLRDIFRANMLRYVPGVTHEQISVALDGGRCFANPKPSAAIDAAQGSEG